MIKISKISKKKAQEILSDVPEDKLFYLAEGGMLRNLEELHKAVDDMQEHVFKHHVNKDKNDFKNWIKEVVKDIKLASDISRTKKKETMSNKIKERIKQLKEAL